MDRIDAIKQNEFARPINFAVTSLPLIIAHRGASAAAPENTLVAFRRALADGADGVECDVRLAKDNVPVVFHDALLKRTALRDGRLCDYASRELAQIGVGAWFNFKFPKKARTVYLSETVPTLAELFELMRENDKLIYVEMKCEDGGHLTLARAIAALIRDFGYQQRVVVKSFAHEAAREIKRLLPEVRVSALFAPRPMRVLHPRKSLINPALHLDADELSLHYSLATERAVQKAIGANLKTVIWTANHPRWIKRALKLGIYGVITNNPARLLDRREQVLAKLDEF